MIERVLRQQEPEHSNANGTHGAKNIANEGGTK
jgi:hypothetical protein